MVLVNIIHFGSKWGYFQYVIYYLNILRDAPNMLLVVSRRISFLSLPCLGQQRVTFKLRNRHIMARSSVLPEYVYAIFTGSRGYSNTEESVPLDKVIPVRLL